MDAFRLVRRFSERVMCEAGHRGRYLSCRQVELIGLRVVAEEYEALGVGVMTREDWFRSSSEIIAGAVGPLFLRQFASDFDPRLHSARLARSMLVSIKDQQLCDVILEGHIAELERFKSLPSVLEALQAICTVLRTIDDEYRPEIEVLQDFTRLRQRRLLHVNEGSSPVLGFGASG
jgi:hypothetical protein